MTKAFKLLGLPAVGIALSTASFAQMTPIAGSGFNVDMIYENAATTTNTWSWDGWSGATTSPQGWDFMQQGEFGANGLNASGTITSLMANTGGNTVFQLASYTGPNAMVCFNANQTPIGVTTPVSSVTYTFTAGAHYDQLALLDAAGYGSRTENVQLNYADGSNTTVSVNFHDWFVGSAANVAVNTDRGHPNSANSNGWENQGGFGLFESDIAADQTKVLNSITLSASSSGDNGYFAAFAVSGHQTQAAPEPVTLIALGAGLLGLLLKKRS